MNTREVETVLGMSQMWGAYVGDHVEIQSLKFFYLEDCIEGGMHKDWLLLYATKNYRRLLHTHQPPEDHGPDLCGSSCTSAHSTQHYHVGCARSFVEWSR